MSTDRAAQEQRAADELTDEVANAAAIYNIEYMDAGRRGEHMPHGLDSVLKPIVAAALAACAREERLEEAKWWAERLNSKRRDKWLYGFKEVERERIEALERAAGESK